MGAPDDKHHPVDDDSAHAGAPANGWFARRSGSDVRRRLSTDVQTDTYTGAYPALLTIVLASVVRNLEAFEIEQLLGRPAGIYVYATRIYDLIQWEPPLFSQAMSLSTLFLAILVLLAVFYQRYSSTHSFATIRPRGFV